MDLPIDERYHQIEGYQEYFVTESGFVYQYRARGVGWQGLRKMALKGINNPKRYLQVAVSENGKIKYLQIHRLVAKYFCDGYFEGAVVNHIDGNKHNNHYTNLEWVTHKENIHKQYITSGVDQVRNCNDFMLISPDDEIIGEFRGRNVACEYVRENNIDASTSQLIRHGESRGYKLVKSKTYQEFKRPSKA